MEKKHTFFEQERSIAKILKMHYLDGFSQAEVAKKLGISAVKVNRLLKIARQSGMIEINIKLPNPHLLDLENRLLERTALKDVLVTPSLDDSPAGDLSLIAQVAADHLVNQIRPRGSICLGGGRTLSEVVAKVEAQKIPGVKILPAIGGVQQENQRDVNELSNRLAEKMGGEAIHFYAPAFAENEGERDLIFSLTHVIKTLEMIRQSDIGIFGIGSLQIDASIIQYCSLPYHQLAEWVKQRNGAGEIAGYIIDDDGEECIPEVNNLVIGISLQEIRNLPISIGVSAGSHKARAIAAAIRGRYFTNLVIDENAARAVLAIHEKERPL